MKLTPRAYHELTSYRRHAMTPHHLDWANQPAQTKSYPGIEPVPLPSEPTLPDRTASEILINSQTDFQPENLAGLEALAGLLHLTCAPTAVLRHGGGGQMLRSVPSAGALYPTEIYIACQNIAGVASGLFHFEPLEQALRLLRPGDPSGAVSSVLGSGKGASSRLTIFLTAVFFRSAWKYRERSYRYHLMDTGHVLENALMALEAFNLPWSFFLDFDDPAAGRFLGLDEKKEVALAVVCIHGRELGTESPPAAPNEFPELSADIVKSCRVSPQEVDYPTLRAIHESGIPPREDPAPPERPMLKHIGPSPDAWSPLPAPNARCPDEPYTETCMARRSSRNFIKESVPQSSLACLLGGLSACAARDRAAGPRTSHALAVGFLAERVKGVHPGYYLFDLDSHETALVEKGAFTGPMSRIALDQAWLAGAALHIFFMANLDILGNSWGPRGYRYALMAAGRLGQRVYLTATALGLGCCGIGAFYDLEAADLLKLAPTSGLLYLLAIGPVRGRVPS